MAKKKKTTKRRRKPAKRAPRRNPYDEIGIATTMPRWILKEVLSGLRVRADFHERGGNWASAAILKEQANRLEEQFLDH